MLSILEDVAFQLGKGTTQINLRSNIKYRVGYWKSGQGIDGSIKFCSQVEAGMSGART